MKKSNAKKLKNIGEAVLTVLGMIIGCMLTWGIICSLYYLSEYHSKIMMIGIAICSIFILTYIFYKMFYDDNEEVLNNKKLNIDSIAGYIKVACPYNGRILSIKASVGDYVKKGDTIVVLDALKMETPIEAPEDGIVAYIGVEEKSTVERETVLFSLY